MVITFVEKERRQKYLIFIFLVIVLITIFILWKSFFVKPKPPKPEAILPVRKIEINFEVLKNPILEQFLIFEKIEPLEPEVKIGKENPFSP